MGNIAHLAAEGSGGGGGGGGSREEGYGSDGERPHKKRGEMAGRGTGFLVNRDPSVYPNLLCVLAVSFVWWFRACVGEIGIVVRKMMRF